MQNGIFCIAVDGWEEGQLTFTLFVCLVPVPWILIQFKTFVPVGNVPFWACHLCWWWLIVTAIWKIVTKWRINQRGSLSGSLMQNFQVIFQILLCCFISSNYLHVCLCLLSWLDKCPLAGVCFWTENLAKYRVCPPLNPGESWIRPDAYGWYYYVSILWMQVST